MGDAKGLPMLRTMWVVALALSAPGCVWMETGPNAPPGRPVSDFDMLLESETDRFYSEGFQLGLSRFGGSTTATLVGRAMWEDPARGGVFAIPRDINGIIGVEVREPPSEAGSIRVVVSEDTATLIGVTAADLWLAPNGRVTGTMTGLMFADPWDDSPSPTTVEVDGPVGIECDTTPSPATLSLADGSVATFDCDDEAVASFTITRS